MKLDAHLAAALSNAQQHGLLRRAPEVWQRGAGHAIVDGRPLLNLSSSDYLGLAQHPALGEAAQQAHAAEGAGAGASRLVCGESPAHRQLERRLANFLQADAALSLSSGYLANLGAIAALAGPEDVIFSDALNHASLIDGCRLSRATIHVYQHADGHHLDELLRLHRTSHRFAWVVTDTLFSMDGDLAPLAELGQLCQRYDANLYADEAHAIGVVGPQGRGACAAVGVTPKLRMIGMGKAFGGGGGALVGDALTIGFLRQRCRPFVFSTATPPAVAAAAAAAIPLIEAAAEPRQRLHAHQRRLRHELKRQGWRVSNADTPIIAAIIGSAEDTMRASHRLIEAGVFVQGIRPPTVPAGTSRLRIVANAAHSDADVDFALRAFATIAASGGCT